MAGITFDTLAYCNILQKAGVPREQAEAFAKANADALRKMAATCNDPVQRKCSHLHLKARRSHWHLGWGNCKRSLHTL